MRDYQDRHRAAAPCDLAEDARLGFGVEAVGRFVQNQKARTPEPRASERQALALSLRKRDAAIADYRVESQGHRGDEFARGSSRQCGA